MTRAATARTSSSSAATAAMRAPSRTRRRSQSRRRNGRRPARSWRRAGSKLMTASSVLESEVATVSETVVDSLDARTGQSVSSVGADASLGVTGGCGSTAARAPDAARHRRSRRVGATSCDGEERQQDAERSRTDRRCAARTCHAGSPASWWAWSGRRGPPATSSFVDTGRHAGRHGAAIAGIGAAHVALGGQPSAPRRPRRRRRRNGTAHGPFMPAGIGIDAVPRSRACR